MLKFDNVLFIVATYRQKKGDVFLFFRMEATEIKCKRRVNCIFVTNLDLGLTVALTTCLTKLIISFFL